jgi:TolA-binding protein
MSASRADRDSSENLLVRARDGDLSEGDRRELQRALETSTTLRVAYQVGQDFDQLAAVKAGDDELIARAAGRALEDCLPGRARGVKGGRSRSRPRRLALALGMAAVLVASTTAAWTGIVRPFLRAHSIDIGGSDAPREEEVLARRARAEHAKPARVGRRAALQTPPDLLAQVDPPAYVPADVPQPQSASDPAQRAPTLAEPRAVVALAGSTAPTPTATDVFRQANLARHAGDLDRARALYGELQTRFPSSDEARLSFVSMGKLLLAAGRAADAERQLSRYLSLGDGELTEEALVARAQSLELLGRNESERQVWQRLLRQFPSSVYGERARGRLADLAAGQP